MQVVLLDVPLCLGDTFADWLQAGGLILGVDGLREDTARYFWTRFLAAEEALNLTDQ